MWLNVPHGLCSRVAPVLVMAGVVTIGVVWSADPGEATHSSVCGECENYDLALTYHDFSACEHTETHDGDCGCGGGDCHLQIVQGKCSGGEEGCGHGNCPPPGDDEDLAASLNEAGATAACLSADQLGRIVDQGDAREIATLVTMFEGSVRVNQDRQALQVMNCAGMVAIHLPLPDSFFETLVLEVE